MSCREASKATGADGACGPVTGGTDPLNSCEPDTGNECGADGLCDGLGTCRVAAPNTKTCEGGTVCSGPTEASGKLCDGLGSCVSSTGTSCLPYICWQPTGLCLQSCVDESQCGTDSYCKNGACVLKDPNGNACMGDEQCMSGHCVDEVCCNQACDIQCRSCIGNRTGGTDGVCGDMFAGLVDSDDPCTVSPTNPCGEDGTCNGSGNCTAFAPADKPCDAVTCDGDALVTKTCNGFGSCNPATLACSPYTCDTSAGDCFQSCSDNDHCAEGYYCDGTGCIDALANGVACQQNEQCLSGFCVENVCCDAACDEACTSCVGNVTGGKNGECGNVLSGGEDPQGICVDDGTACGADGLCDGEGACRDNAPQGTSCGEDACDAAAVVSLECTGDGDCENVAVKNCAPYACDSNTTNCLTACINNDDCSSGAQCNPDTGECGNADAVCKDAFTVANADGSETSCKPYKCQGGVCRELCDNSNDCADGYACQGSKCVEQVADGGAGDAANDVHVEQDKGCGCRNAGAPVGKGAAAWLLALAASVAWRRRRQLHPKKDANS